MQLVGAASASSLAAPSSLCDALAFSSLAKVLPSTTPRTYGRHLRTLFLDTKVLVPGIEVLPVRGQSLVARKSDSRRRGIEGEQLSQRQKSSLKYILPSSHAQAQVHTTTSNDTMAKRIKLSSPTFTHEPLTDPGKEIRLLRFKPKRSCSNNLRNIDLELMTWPFSDAPPYVAASYTWGSPENARYVTLNGYQFEVRRNCLEALKQIRSQDPEAYVWTDSICINQDDFDEKALQVEMMGEIYERAGVVYACVGGHGEGSEDVVRVVREVAGCVEKLGWEGDAARAVLQRLWEMGVMTSSPDDGGVLREDLKSALSKFGNRAYWSRVWIIQEVRLARHCLVLCGGDSISLDDIGMLEYYIGTHGRLDLFERKGFVLGPADWRLSPLWGVVRRPEPPLSRQPSARKQLMDISIGFARFSSWQCSDARDRLYALSKVVLWPGMGEPPRPDYRIAPFDLVREVLRRLPHDEFRQCAVPVRCLLRGFGLTVRDAQVQRALPRRNIECPPIEETPGKLVGLCHKDPPPTALRILDLGDSKLSLDVAHYKRPRRPEHPQPRPPKIGIALWADQEIVGHACPDTHPGDILLEVRGIVDPSEWIILRKTPPKNTYHIIGPALPSHPKLKTLDIPPEDDGFYHTDTPILYPKSPLFFDLWLEEEDFLLWEVYAHSLQSGVLDEGEVEGFLGYQVAREGSLSCAVLREDVRSFGADVSEDDGKVVNGGDDWDLGESGDGIGGSS